jgi:hypothetical protein
MLMIIREEVRIQPMKRQSTGFHAWQITNMPAAMIQNSGSQVRA